MAVNPNRRVIGTRYGVQIIIAIVERLFHPFSVQ